MKLKFSSVLFFVLITFNCIAQPTGSGIHITFTVNSPELSNDSSVFITGSLAQLSYWNPGKVKMQSEANHTWGIEIKIDTPSSIEYKYTLGSWEREGTSSNGSPLQNFSVRITHDTIISDHIYFWKKGTPNKTVKGQITGTVKYHLAMKGEGLADRDVIVWLPPDYDKNKSQRYPVLYMQDGENVFDPATSSFGVDWRIDESCDSLIKIHAIKPVIVIGIYNTIDRSKEYSPGEKGDAYMNFVVRKLKPFIDSVYRTMPDRNHTLVGGSSAGGTISFMLLWEHAEIFSKAICMSPAFKIDDIDVVKWVNDYKGAKKKIFLYCDVGGVGLETQLQPGVNEMISALKAEGYKQGRNFVYVSDSSAKHSEAFWAKRFPYAIESCLKK